MQKKTKNECVSGCEEKRKGYGERETIFDEQGTEVVKEEIKGCEFGREEVNIRCLERRQQNECDLELRLLEKQNRDEISELFVSIVITPDGKFFNENSMFRASRSERTRKE